jgi:hypothetical protein
VQKNILIGDRAKRQFKVMEIVCDDCFTCKVPTEARERHIIPITFTAGKEPGDLTKEIKILTDLGQNVVAKIKCQATIEPSEPVPSPTVAPDALTPITTGGGKNSPIESPSSPAPG